MHYAPHSHPTVPASQHARNLWTAKVFEDMVQSHLLYRTSIETQGSYVRQLIRD
jgi:hypothetical protein